MTNEQLKVIQKYIKLKPIVESLPIQIPNWKEKSAGNNGKGKGKYRKHREFTPTELNTIYHSLLAIAHTIIHDYKTTDESTSN